MKAQSIANKTTAMKARVFNQIRTQLFPHLKYSWKVDTKEISDEEKIKLFNEWMVLTHEAHWELNAYKAKRKKKTKIYTEREKRKLEKQ